MALGTVDTSNYIRIAMMKMELTKMAMLYIPIDYGNQLGISVNPL